MALVDSLEKVIGSYFKLFTAQRFTYKKVAYAPTVLRVSENVFRGYTCPAQCGACCFRFSLDYLPTEDQPENVKPRLIAFDGRQVEIYSDLQDDHSDHFCNRLNKQNGRCSIHGKHPFTCDFELLRSITSVDGERFNNFTLRLYGRGWQMTQIDGSKGAMCEILPPTPETAADSLRKVRRLKQWMEHFGLKHCCDEVIAWMEAGPHNEPAFFNQAAAIKKPQFGFF